MSSFTVPYEGGTRVACSVCAWYSDEEPSAIVAEGRGSRHDRAWHPEGERFKLSLEDAAMTAAASYTTDGPKRRGHVHGPQCTIESCGLVRFTCPDKLHCNAKMRLGYEPQDCEGHLPPSRVDLIEASLRRRNG